MNSTAFTRCQSTSYIGWIDLLRIVACIAVVLAHNCDPFVGQFLNDKAAFYTGASIGSLMRPSVPLFVMITAVLLLPLKPDTTVNSFYRKRLWRIIPPLVFWSVLLPVLALLYFRHVAPDSVNPILNPSLYDSASTWTKVLTFVFNFNFDTVPLWYLYMLLGLYLVIPIIGTWLSNARRKEIKAVLWVWAVTLLLPYVEKAAPLLGYVGNYDNMGILGVCDWNPYGTFYYLSGFIGYVILAYYLKTYPPQWSASKMAAICIPSFIIGYLITFMGFVEINNNFPGQYAMLEIIWYFCSLNVVMMTVPVFLFFSRLKIRSSAWLRNLASLTFGIYLCHYIFVFMAYDLMAHTGMPYLVRILSSCAIAFLCAAAVTWLFYRWRPTRRLVE